MNTQPVDFYAKQKAVIEPLAHCRCLNIQVVAASKGRLTLRLPYSKNIIGDPNTMVIHGGAITALMDTACGFAGISALDGFSIAPTMDLKIDYLNMAIPNKALIAEASVYCVKKSIIFTEAVAFHEDNPKHLIARCSANFVRLTL